MCLNFIYCNYNLILCYPALTTNAVIVFIIHLYTHLLESKCLLIFIVVIVFLEVNYIYTHCISTVFLVIVFIKFLYLFIFIGLDQYFLDFNTCTIKFNEGKFYFEGRACYIGKIKPTCIE